MQSFFYVLEEMLKFFSVVDEVKAIGRFKLTLNKDTFSWTIKLVELLVASNYDFMVF